MNTSVTENEMANDHRYQGLDPAEPPKLILGLLLGFSIGFVNAVGIVFLIRGLESKDDGFRALRLGLPVAIGAILLTGAIWFAQRNQPRDLSAGQVYSFH